MTLTEEDMDRVLRRRETSAGDWKRPMTAVGRANAIQHLIRIRDRCAEGNFLLSVDKTTEALRGAPVTRLKDLYKVIALVDSMLPADRVFLSEGARSQVLDRYRALAKVLQSQCCHVTYVEPLTWKDIHNRVDEHRTRMISIAQSMQSKLERGRRIPKKWPGLLQTWLLAALYVYYPPRKNEYASLKIRGYNDSTDNFVSDGKIVLNQYSTSYYRGSHSFTIPAEMAQVLAALVGFRLNGECSDEVYLFHKANGQPLLADAYSDAVRRAFKTATGVSIAPSSLALLFVDYHAASGTLPPDIERLMGRYIKHNKETTPPNTREAPSSPPAKH